MTATACIHTYDRPEMLPYALDGVRDLDAIIVAATLDSDEAAARAWSARTSVPVKIVRQPPATRANGGYAAMRNRVLDLVETTHAFIIDDDESVHPSIAKHICSVPVGHFGVFGRWDMADREGMTWHANALPDTTIRLIPRHSRYRGLMHEKVFVAPSDRHENESNWKQYGACPLWSWGWACKYPFATRKRGYDACGAEAFQRPTVDEEWNRFVAEQPRTPLPLNWWNDPPVPRVVLDQWRSGA